MCTLEEGRGWAGVLLGSPHVLISLREQRLIIEQSAEISIVSLGLPKWGEGNTASGQRKKGRREGATFPCLEQSTASSPENTPPASCSRTVAIKGRRLWTLLWARRTMASGKLHYSHVLYARNTHRKFCPKLDRDTCLQFISLPSSNCSPETQFPFPCGHPEFVSWGHCLYLIFH